MYGCWTIAESTAENPDATKCDFRMEIAECFEHSYLLPLNAENQSPKWYSKFEN